VERNVGARTAVSSVLILALAGSMLLIGPQAASALACTLPMEVSPTSGVPGTSITITGTGFEPLTRVEVFFDSLYLAAIDRVDFSGSWSLTAEVPEYPAGTYPLRYVAQPPGGGSATVFCSEPDFTVFADLVVTPTTATTAPPPTAATPTTTTTVATTTSTTATTTTTIAAATTGTSLVAASGEDTTGAGGTLIGVLIGLAIAMALGVAWLLGRRTAPAAYPPPAPPYRRRDDDGE